MLHRIVIFALGAISGLYSKKFTGRKAAGKIASAFLFKPIELLYRVRFFLSSPFTGGYFTCSRFQLIRAHFERRKSSLFVRHLARGLTVGCHNDEERVAKIMGFFKDSKSYFAAEQPWLLPAEALWMPRLDCKGFSVLFHDMACALGLKSRLWMGVDKEGSLAHCWVEIEVNSKPMFYQREPDEMKLASSTPPEERFSFLYHLP